jgi:quinol monooxygenase YgiN
MYVLHRDAQDPSLFVFIEHWKSRQALDAHMETDHFRTLEAALQEKLAQPMIVHVLRPVQEEQ